MKTLKIIMFALFLVNILYAGDVRYKISQSNINSGLNALTDARALSFSRYYGSHGVSNYSINVTTANISLNGTNQFTITANIHGTANINLAIFDFNIVGDAVVEIEGILTLSPNGDGFVIEADPTGSQILSGSPPQFMIDLVNDELDGLINQIPTIRLASFTNVLPDVISSYFASQVPVLEIINNEIVISLQTVGPKYVTVRNEYNGDYNIGFVSELVSSIWEDYESPKHFAWAEGSNHTVRTKDKHIYHNNSDIKYEKWKETNETTQQINVVADIDKKRSANFEDAQPVTVQNDFIAVGNAGDIIFEGISHTSPYSDYAFMPPNSTTIEAPESQEYNNIDWFFQYWNDGNSNNTRNISPGTPTTYTATYKGHFISSDADAYSTNSMRKLVRTDDGKYHTVYIEDDKLWITSSQSTDFNGNWEGEVLLSGYDDIQYKNVSIDVYGNDIAVVCEGYIPSEDLVYIEAFSFDTQTKQMGGLFGPGDIFDPEYFGLVKPVVGYDYNQIWILYRPDPESGIKYWFTGNNTGTIPNTDSESQNPSIAMGEINHTSKNNVFITWQKGITSIHYIKYNYNTATFEDYSDISEGSGFTRNQYPSISASSQYYPIVSWTGSFKNVTECGMAKPNDVSMWQHRVVVRPNWRGYWESFYNTGDAVEYTNNNSTSQGLEYSLESIITFSQDEGNSSKYIKRIRNSYTVGNLSHAGIQTQVSNGNNFNTIKATVFDDAGNPPYLIQRSTTEFGSISKQTTELPISSGRKGVVVINGIEFVFYTGDIQVENHNIEFITLPDSFVVNSLASLNESMYSQPFELSNGYEILFSNFYYVINYDSTDSLLSVNDQIHFKLELVKENTNEIVATYDDIVYTIQNLQKHENKNYLIHCNNIEQGNYFFRLVTEVNGNASYFLSNIHNDQNSLAKRAYIREDLNTELPPSSFVLKQNYPNPFNPVTNIYFELPAPSKVSLIVYDIKGSVVSKLVNGQLNEGRYSIPFDGSELASGLYFYVIDAKDYSTGSNFRQVKKMMLVK